MDLKSKIILIAGQTASGKSKFAIQLAKKINGDLDVGLDDNTEDDEYLNKDITCYDWSKINKDKTLIVFDDHVCFSERIDFLIKNKFKHIILDDNLPNNFISYYTPKMIYEKQVLIKKQFIKYTNIKRLTGFLYDFLFLRKFKAILIMQ